MKISKIIIVLFMITIALAPIYWFFHISPMLLSMIKVILLSMMLFFAFAYAMLSTNMRKYMAENRNINYLFVIILVFMLIGILTKNNQSLYSLQSNEYNMFLYSFVLAYLAYFVTYISQINNIDVYQILVWPAVFIVIVSLMHIGIVLADYEIYTPYLRKGETFEFTAFGAARVGWSNQIALFTIILPTYVKLKGGSHMKILLSFVISSLPIMYSQILAGGRSGFLTSIFLVTIFMLYFLPKKYFITIASVILILALSGFLSTLNEEFKRGSVQKAFVDFTKPINYDMINTLTSNRIDQYAYALNKLQDRPILGVGIGNARIISEDSNNGLEIHNVFLRFALESGLILSIVLLYPFLYAFVRLWRIYKIRKSRRLIHIYGGSDINKYTFNIFISSVIVVSGLIIASLEPRHIYGGMSSSWIWWLSLSILVFNSKMLSYRKSNHSAGIIESGNYS